MIAVALVLEPGVAERPGDDRRQGGLLDPEVGAEWNFWEAGYEAGTGELVASNGNLVMATTKIAVRWSGVVP